MTAQVGVALLGWLACAGLIAERRQARRAHARRLAHALHELRGPLGTIALWTESVRRRGGLPSWEVAGLELAVSRVRLALGDLERVPRRRARHRTGRQQLVAVPALVEACRREVAIRAPDRTVRIDTTAGGELLVRGERVRLAQAVGNLLANAIEHGSGTVTVTVRGTGATVRIEVADEGRGLPAPLVDLRRRGHRRPGAPHGHGLGIAEQVARSHGGELRSAPALRGARLVLVLPHARARVGRASGGLAA